MFLTSCFVGLYITSAIIGFTPSLNSQGIQDKAFWLEAAGAVAGVATTVISVVLIFHSIYSASRMNVLSSGGRRYMNILYFLTKSSALYAIGLVLCAIPVAIPLTESNTLWQQSWTWYSEPIFSFSSVSTLPTAANIGTDFFQGHGSHTRRCVRCASSR